MIGQVLCSFQLRTLHEKYCNICEYFSKPLLQYSKIFENSFFFEKYQKGEMQTPPATFINIAWIYRTCSLFWTCEEKILWIQYKNPGEVNAKVNVPNIALTFKSFPCSVEASGNESFSTFIAVSERLIFCRPDEINILSLG